MEKDHLQLHAPWQEVKEKLKENDHRLTDEDLRFDGSDGDALLSRLSKKLNRTTAEVKALIESIATNQGKAS